MAESLHLMTPACSSSRGRVPERHALVTGRAYWALSTPCCRSVKARQRRLLPSSALQGLDQRCHVCDLQGPDTLGAQEDMLQVYVSTPLGTGVAQLSLPLISSFLQASRLLQPVLLARPYLMPYGHVQPACKSTCCPFTTLADTMAGFRSSLLQDADWIAAFSFESMLIHSTSLQCLACMCKPLDFY